MNSDCVLDACALIAFLNDEEGAEKIEELLRLAERKERALLLHEINFLEIYYGVYRDEGNQMADHVWDKILCLPVEVIRGLESAVFQEAGRLKALYAVSLADSIALAEAKTRGVPLVTCDHHEFDKLEQKGELFFSWIR
jgi:uncharacterized protein